jgi:hypothetical protein
MTAKTLTRTRREHMPPKKKKITATIGVENQAGTDALQYSFNETVLKDASAIRFSPKAA